MGRNATYVSIGEISKSLWGLGMVGQWKAFIEAKAALSSAHATINDLKSARANPTRLLIGDKASGANSALSKSTPICCIN